MLEPAFNTRGFNKWRDATARFPKHEESECHKDATQVIITIPEDTHDVGEMLSHTLAVERKENRGCLHKILSNILFWPVKGMQSEVTMA